MFEGVLNITASFVLNLAWNSTPASTNKRGKKSDTVFSTEVTLTGWKLNDPSRNYATCIPKLNNPHGALGSGFSSAISIVI